MAEILDPCGATFGLLSFASLRRRPDVLVAGDFFAGDLFAGDLFAGDLFAGDLFAGDLFAGDFFAGDFFAGAIEAPAWLLRPEGRLVLLRLRGVVEGSCSLVRSGMVYLEFARCQKRAGI